MPTLFKMSDEKQTADSPAVVIAETQAPTVKRNTKKYVIIGLSSILGVAIILTAILVGMYMFTEAQKEIVQYTLNFNKNSKQDVSSDPNTNIVQYHVTNPGHEAWIINDFNKDIQVVKIKSETETNCYVNALNRSTAMDPTKVARPTSNDFKGANSLTYVKSNTPISDTSFLSKAARDTCKGVSVYWVYPHCASDVAGSPNTTDIKPSARNRRAYVDNSPYYIKWDTTYNGYQIWCIQGCCRTVCACSVTFYWYSSGGYIYCTWYYYNCPPRIYPTKVYDYCSTGPRGLSCPNQYPTYPPTC